jgi:hypothetical protein
MVLFRMLFMNTAENSVEMRDNLRGPWFDVIRSPALNLGGASTPFDETVLKSVRSPSYVLFHSIVELC